MDSKLSAVVFVDLFFLPLIGIGPKIALVPFLDVTAGMDAATKARVTRKMLTTAAVVAVSLVALGELLTRLLHFSQGAFSIAGGIVLLIIAVSMILKTDDPDTRIGRPRRRTRCGSPSSRWPSRSS